MEKKSTFDPGSNPEHSEHTDRVGVDTAVAEVASEAAAAFSTEPDQNDESNAIKNLEDNTNLPLPDLAASRLGVNMNASSAGGLDPDSSVFTLSSRAIYSNTEPGTEDLTDVYMPTTLGPRLNRDNSVCILSFNCWGLKYISENRCERIRELAAVLAQSPQYDIVALQELWVEDDFDVLRIALSSRLPHCKRFISGVFAGPGLAVFSRWPIVDTWLHRFPLNGRPSALHRGDWYVGKALSGTLIAHPSGKLLEILNSHMHAPYGPGDAAYTCHRAAQAWDIARAARRSKEQGHVTFVVGDLNSVPGSVHYSLFEHHGGLADAWIQCKGEYTGAIAGLSAEDQVRVAGVTADSRLNTWRSDYEPNRAKRLDYIFFDPSTAAVLQCAVDITHKSATAGSLSDHFGVSATFVLNTSAKASTVDWPEPAPASPSDLSRLYDEVLVILAQYAPVTQAQSDWRLVHMIFSVIAFLAMLVAVWWAAADGRSYVGFLFILFGGLILLTGVIDGLIALLFGPSERRALREFESEVWRARDVAASRDLPSTRRSSSP